MTAAIADLLLMVPPPPNPSNATGDWGKIERELGLVFPTDYKQFIDRYGSGTLCKVFEIRSPFGLEQHYNKPIREAWSSWAGIYHCWEDDQKAQVPFPLYPRIPGLLPWGTYGDVNVIGWLTHPDPEKWYTVYQDQHEGFFELHEVGFANFLAAALRGELPLPEAVFGTRVVHKPRTYKPF